MLFCALHGYRYSKSEVDSLGIQNQDRNHEIRAQGNGKQGANGQRTYIFNAYEAVLSPCNLHSSFSFPPRFERDRIG